MGNYFPKYKRKLKLTARYVEKPFKFELSLQYLLGRNEIVLHGGLAAPRKRDRESFKGTRPRTGQERSPRRNCFPRTLAR